MEAKKITILHYLKNWNKVNKGPIESEVFNLTKGIKNLGTSIWFIIKTIGLLIWSIYCWIAVIRATPKLKPWVSFSIELAIFGMALFIPILNMYIDNVQTKDKYQYQSYQLEQEYEQKLIKAELDGYNRGLREANNQENKKD